MRELEQVIGALTAAASRGEPAVLATVLRIEGSVYRGVGARMVVSRSGETIGAVSGGCLEADIVARAPDLLASGRPELVRYDTRESDADLMGLGMGCRGLIDVLLEPLEDTALYSAISMYSLILSRHDEVTIETLGRILGVVSEGEFRVVTGEGGEVLAGDAALLGRPDDLLREVIPPALALLLCGAGSDAIPVARLAKQLGWRVTVVDHRRSFLDPSRFPDADERHVVDLATDPAALVALGVSARTMAVVMAHSAVHDGAWLHALLDAGAGYIGVLGPRRRTLELLDDRAAAGIPATVHSPVGLDLGAETPDEIALSIVAEIAAVHARRPGGMLRDKAGPIHEDRSSGA